MAETLSDIINGLPRRNITVFTLKSLDYIIPGEWENTTDFTELVKAVTKETDTKLIEAVSQRANELYTDPNERYQQAMRLYRIADRADKTLAEAAMLDKIGEKVKLLSFIRYFTPQSDTAQTLDFSLKLIIELLAFCQINGIPGDSVGDFVKALADYNKESLMRVVAIVCFDGIVPLGSDFTRGSINLLEKLSPQQLGRNALYKQLSWAIPGKTATDKLGFITNTIGSLKAWIDSFVTKHNLTAKDVVGSLENFIEITDDRLDYIAAFIDISTNYVAHTGAQTLARRVVERAVNEI